MLVVRCYAYEYNCFHLQPHAGATAIYTSEDNSKLLTVMSIPISTIIGT